MRLLRPSSAFAGAGRDIPDTNVREDTGVASAVRALSADGARFDGYVLHEHDDWLARQLRRAAVTLEALSSKEH